MISIRNCSGEAAKLDSRLRGNDEVSGAPPCFTTNVIPAKAGIQFGPALCLYWLGEAYLRSTLHSASAIPATTTTAAMTW